MVELKPNIHDEANSLDYVLVGDYYIPAIELPEADDRPSGSGGGCKCGIDGSRPGNRKQKPYNTGWDGSNIFGPSCSMERGKSMWNCDWEYENQETLRQWYEEKISGKNSDSAVRRIICKGADGFSTRRSAPRNIAITICAGTVVTKRI